MQGGLQKKLFSHLLYSVFSVFSVVQSLALRDLLFFVSFVANLVC